MVRPVVTDNTDPVLQELVPGAKNLYFIFGGINAGIGMPPFEFYKSSQIINQNKLFVRDFSQTWYQNGLEGIAKDIYGIGDYVKETIQQLQPEKVYYIGNSMGGFAAIAMAAMTGHGKAIAFAPQTFIGPLKRIRHWDRRWQGRMLATWKTSFYRKHIYDLLKHLKSNPGDYSVDIYVSSNHRRDLAHSNNIKNLKNVNVHEYDIGGHQLVKHLRDNGQLADILSM
ncbi:MAG: hypothetical protein JEZ07_00865 [Phycisphaerae bacterium]|nr:hypothetical protein [Phycisphaerae bacterium]